MGFCLSDVTIAADSILDIEVFSQEFRITSPSDQTIEYSGLYFYEQDTSFAVVGVGANRVFRSAELMSCAPWLM